MHKRVLATIETLEPRQLLSGEPWGLYPQLVGQDLAVQNYPQLTGKGFTVAVIDSGIDYNHPVLGGGVGLNLKVLAGWDFVDNDNDPWVDSPAAHATGMGGIIAGNPYVYGGSYFQGVAPQANLVVLRQNSSTNVAQAFDWVIANQHRFNIVAVAVTDFYTSTFNPTLYQSQAATLAAMGVFMATPGGNLGPSVPVAKVSPAGLGSIYGTTAIDRNGAVASFAQRDINIDAVAPGVGVTVPFFDWNTHKDSFIVDDGSCWSAAYTVGTAVLIKQINPDFTAEQIMSIIRDSGVTTYDATTKQTFPRLNVNAAIALAYARLAGTTQSTPFSGTPLNISGTLEAENYDNGGEGAAYHDLTLSNEGMRYRGNGVDIENAGDTGGGYDVGWAQAGEWLNYTVNIPAAGTYSIDTRVASSGAGGAFHFELDGASITGAMAIPNTGGWQKWTTITAAGISLPAGTHTLRIVFDSNSAIGYVGNVNWLRINGGPAPTQSPFSGSPLSIPGQIELENFDKGGEGVAFHDLSAANSGNQYRTAEGIDIERSSEGGYDVGWNQPGEWLEYTVNVPTAGTYDLSLRAAYGGVNASGGTVHVESDGADISGPITLPKTGNWQSWQTVTRPGLSLSAGQHVLRLVFDADGAGSTASTAYVANLNWMKLTPAGLPTPTLQAPWISADIGACALTGSASSSGGVYTLQASGTDIWNNADAFRFVYQTLSGDGQIIARVDSLDNTDPWAKAGVMFRDGLGANAKNVYMAISPTSGTAFQYRKTAGSYSIGMAGPKLAAPSWLKLVRQGSTFSGYVSNDGVAWTLVGSQSIAMSTTLHVGLALTGHNNGVLNTATLSNVSL